jgi:hypothetical protein
MERSDVLEGDEDVPVELDVRHVLERAIGREDSFLVLAAEQRDLDLLPLVLVRVVLQGGEASAIPHGCVVAHAVHVAKCGAGVVPVWSRSCRLLRQLALDVPTPFSAVATTSYRQRELRGCHVDARLARDIERSLPPRDAPRVPVSLSLDELVAAESS